ncbi:RluA family pseudouridine synthase [Enterobacteriaceae endosymbiont of Donacia tomentosa]|uniref:RluA family pseudouridine synthase n=1 Tax=Enterobacteriaceae endosymbiont of Donacia tomentosa TaxID=2675787 RepID=UPI0014497FF6|nr:RluA family pseudouridine synthase [Enterobacteriaceae endosymbiont of Donacia tomentosa]QJC31534.1 RluA family pseudouridine synthase [Enterobacteriaceae endosymbiont of Donacia tomentosa]
MYKIINSKFLIVPSDIEKQRIDNFLINKFKNIPKSMIYRVLRQGKIKVNKHKVSPNYKITSQDILKLPYFYSNQNIKKKYFPKLQKINFLKKTIIFEDKYILAINKPYGLAVHGGSGINYGIIENFRFLYKKNFFLELVHRIDKETSGVLLMAKKRSALKILQEQLRKQDIIKEYIALVKGNYFKKKYTLIKGFLLKNFLNKKIKVQPSTHEGKYSETKFRVIKNYEEVMLVKIKPLTGRTHQIRVHMSHIGCPIINDQRYGSKIFNTKFKKKNKLNRLFLHAKNIQFIHPITKKNINITAPLDSELSNCLLQLNYNK